MKTQKMRFLVELDVDAIDIPPEAVDMGYIIKEVLKQSIFVDYHNSKKASRGVVQVTDAREKKREIIIQTEAFINP